MKQAIENEFWGDIVKGNALEHEFSYQMKMPAGTTPKNFFNTASYIASLVQTSEKRQIECYISGYIGDEELKILDLMEDN